MEEEGKLTTAIELIATSKLDLPEEKAIAKIFLTQKEIDSNTLQLDSSEIQYLQAFDVEEIANMIQEQPQEFAPTFIRHFFCFREAYRKKL